MKVTKGEEILQPAPLPRSNVASVYRRGGTQQNTTMEMTYEELQRNLGLGVDIG